MKKVAFKVLANNQDITDLIKDRLIKLSVHDAAGEKSDTVSIELDNRDEKIQFPATGASLEVWIGEEGALMMKGIYEVDELSEPIEEDVLSIHGKAAKMKGSLLAKKDAVFDDISLGDLLADIAQAHGYEAVISPELSVVMYEHIDQKGESDMNLLTRLARDQGAIAKPVANRLVVISKGASKSASGQALHVEEITDRANSTGRITIQERNDYQAVKAAWFDEDKQQSVVETAGQGDPCHVIRTPYKDQEKAKAAAKSKLGTLQRGKATLSITRPLNPAIVAEGRLNISQHKKSINGEWLVEDVDHVIGSGSVGSTSINCVMPS